MFCVVYRFRVKPGCAAAFVDAWRAMTHLIAQHQGSLGSRLHLAGEDEYVAYAQWPSRQDWEAPSAMPDEAAPLRTAMREACERVEVLHELTVTDDLLLPATGPGTPADHVPRGVCPVNPYLTVEDPVGLIEFLVEVFGAEEVHRTCLPEGTVAHALLRLAGGTVEINEACAGRPAQLGAVHVFVPDTDAAFARGVAAGATALFPPSDAPFGQRIAALGHPSGTCWYLGARIDVEA